MYRENPPRTTAYEVEKKYREQLRERFFHQLVATKLLERIADEMAEADFSEQEIREINAAFAELSEEDRRAVLAYPAVLRPKIFEKYAERLKNGEVSPAEMVAEMRDKAREAGFSIGFHLSQADIKPQRGDWMIKGTEKDHRHDDVPMAYYSLDYAHRYLKKPSRFLYIVRVELKDDSGHYRDNDDTWGHAPSLAIIDQIDMLALERELDERMRAAEDTQKEKEAA